MIIDFKQQQLKQFLTLFSWLKQHPEEYKYFTHVADFYQATWFEKLPKSVDYAVTGLDDGAEEFSIRLSLYGHVILLDCAEECYLRYIAAD